MNIFGVDPGKETGVLRYDTTHRAVEMDSLPAMEAVDWIFAWAAPGDLVMCERFTFEANAHKMTRQNDALEVIGALRWVCRRCHTQLVLSGSGDAFDYSTRAPLTALGWWRVGDPDHVRRAAAQAALGYSQVLPDEFERRLTPGMI